MAAGPYVVGCDTRTGHYTNVRRVMPPASIGGGVFLISEDFWGRFDESFLGHAFFLILFLFF